MQLASNFEPAPLPVASSSLPDAPMPATPLPSTGEGMGQVGALSAAPVAGKYAMIIQPGQTAPKIGARTKVLAGVRDSFTLFSFVGWLASAGYAQAIDGSPNYGEVTPPLGGDGKRFAQRLGASAARATSENLFTEAVLAPVLHEDARYYRMGKGHNVIKRLAYSGTRGLITRTDGGHQTLNIANLGGNLAGSYLTKAYYPAFNSTNSQVLQTFGGSVGGSALGYVVQEFLPDILHHNR